MSLRQRSRSKSRSKPNSRTKTKKVKTKENKDWEILIRAVNGQALNWIYVFKGVYPNPSATWVPGIYTHYFSSKMDPEQMKSSCMRKDLGKFILVFHPDVLKDIPFVICNANMQGRCINPMFTEEEQKEWRLLESPGNLEARPDMNAVSDWVNWYLDPTNEDPRTIKRISKNRLGPDWIKMNKWLNKWLGDRATKQKEDFTMSHEVIFPMIPLKYIINILTWDKKTIPTVKLYFPKIPVTLIDAPGTPFRRQQYIEEDDEVDPFYCRNHFFPILKKIYQNLKPLRKDRKKRE